MVLDMPTIAERQKALETLPTDLDNSFKGIITRIQSRRTDLGMRVLMWLHFARRPLKLIELQHALAVEKGDPELNIRNIPSPEVLLNHCFGLVLIDKDISTVRFTHFTVEEYFRQNDGKEFPNGCSYIAETCLTYLNFGGLRQHCIDDDILTEKSTTYPFLNYAARYWGTYVKQQCSDSLIQLAGTVLEHETNRPPCAIQAFYCQTRWIFAKKFSGVHVTAYFGLTENMAKFSEVDLKDETGQTPLMWAAQAGHEAVVQLLVEKDSIDINAKNKDGMTPFMLAASNGHEAVVRLLVEKDGVDINAKDNEGMTSLMWAASNGYEAVVRLLIERDGVDINAKDNIGVTPLMRAARGGCEAVVRLLIERDGVDINAKDNQGRTPLIWVAWGGYVAVVRLLVEKDGVDVDAKDNNGRTPLLWAAQEGREAVVRLLIETGVDVDAKDNNGRTPLMWAAQEGHEAVVRLLIETGVDIDDKDNNGRTPLMWAAKGGCEAVVRLLIEGSADIDAKDNEGNTALALAVPSRWLVLWRGEAEYKAVVRLLQAQGSDQSR